MRLYEKIVEKMIKENEISVQDRELYEYGITTLILKIMFFIFVILGLVIIDEIVTGVAFMVMFICLRRVAGGMHCSRIEVCFAISVMVVILSSLLIKYNLFGIIYYRCITAVSQICIVLIGPVDCDNKQASYGDKKYFCIQEKKLLLIASIFIIVLALLGINRIEKAIESAIIVCGITTAFFGNGE